jgi:hypothetical protein
MRRVEGSLTSTLASFIFYTVRACVLRLPSHAVAPLRAAHRAH